MEIGINYTIGSRKFPFLSTGKGRFNSVFYGRYRCQRGDQRVLAKWR